MGKLAMIGLIILTIFSIYLIGVIPDSFGVFKAIFSLLPFIFIGMFLYKIL